MARITVLSLNINAGFDLSRRRFLLPALRDAIHDVGVDAMQSLAQCRQQEAAPGHVESGVDVERQQVDLGHVFHRQQDIVRVAG